MGKGSKIPVLESERFIISDDGRGLIFYNDGTNVYKASWDGKTAGKFSGSADAWMKVHFISGSSFGPTGAALYIPCWLKTA